MATSGIKKSLFLQIYVYETLSHEVKLNLWDDIAYLILMKTIFSKVH